MQNKSLLAGIFTLIAGAWGVLSLGWAFLLVVFVRSPAFQPSGGVSRLPVDFVSIATVMYIVWGVVFAALGAFGITGGVFCLKRKHWGLALAGAIAGIITFFPCGIPAVIFVSLARNEFQKPQPPTSPVVPSVPPAPPTPPASNS